MRLILQRVKRGGVKVGGETVSQIKQGLVVLVGFAEGDSSETVRRAAEKILSIRLWSKVDSVFYYDFI